MIMSPFTIIVRLGLSLIAAVCALGLFLFFSVGQRDIASAIACALGFALISDLVAPSSCDVQALLERLSQH